MAITSVGTIGTGQSKAAGTSFTFGNPFTNALEAGNIGILVVATDNISTVDGNSNDHTSVTDSVGNTWVKQREFTNGAAAAGSATVSVWKTKATTTLPTTGTITVNFSASVTAKAASVWEFSVAAGNDIRVVPSGTPNVDAAYDGVDVNSVSTSGLPSAEHLHVRGIASERANATITPTAGFTAMTNNGTTGGGAATNMNVTPEFRIAVNIADTSNPTSTAVDHATTFTAFEEFTPVTAILVADSGSGSETLLINKNLLVPESSSGLETILVNKNLLLAESGLGADAILAGKQFFIADSGVGSDAVAVTKLFQIVDSGSGVDNLLIGKNLLVLDSGVGSETITVVNLGGAAVGKYGAQEGVYVHPIPELFVPLASHDEREKELFRIRGLVSHQETISILNKQELKVPKKVHVIKALRISEPINTILLNIIRLEVLNKVFIERKDRIASSIKEVHVKKQGEISESRKTVIKRENRISTPQKVDVLHQTVKNEELLDLNWVLKLIKFLESL